MSRKKTNILFIIMATVAIVIFIGTGAYAYYQTNIKGTTNGTIAKWDYDNYQNDYSSKITNMDLIIIAQQLTGYTEDIPMQLFESTSDIRIGYFEDDGRIMAPCN